VKTVLLLQNEEKVSLSLLHSILGFLCAVTYKVIILPFELYNFVLFFLLVLLSSCPCALPPLHHEGTWRECM
jgi:hypothetical protein